MSKSPKFAGAKSTHPNRGIPFVVVVGLCGSGLFGYVLSQLFLPVEAHSAYWVVALISAVLGAALGWLWYRWRGDII